MADDPHQDPSHDEDEFGGPVKPFLEHLEDLRWVLIRCLTALAVGMGVCLAAAPTLLEVLQYPLWLAAPDMKLDFLGPLGAISSSMKVGLYGGVIFSLPFILYFLAQYIVPALRPLEKKYFRQAFIIGGGLFLLGALLCYTFVLRISLKGMIAYSSWLGYVPNFWRAEEYFSFVTLLMLVMGLSFEMPVVILTLVKLGIVRHEWLVKGRRYFFFGNVVICAFITPDFLSTFFLVIPTQVLLEICIIISARWEKKRLASETALTAEAPYAD